MCVCVCESLCLFDFRSGDRETKQHTTDAPSSGQSRKRKRSDVQKSETLTTNTPTCQSSSSCHGDDLSCHGNRGPKRQKLNHSHYSITLDEDPTSLDVPRVAKVTIACSYSINHLSCFKASFFFTLWYDKSALLYTFNLAVVNKHS